MAGSSGVRFMRQDAPDKFTDVTAATKLPKNVTSAAYTGAWAVDIEADGDLDIVMGTKDGTPKVLRNNGDDTFKEIEPFTGISGLRAFAWADFDGDGNADAAIIDGAGKLHIFHNERQGQFREVKLPDGLPTVKALRSRRSRQRRRAGFARRGIDGNDRDGFVSRRQRMERNAVSADSRRKRRSQRRSAIASRRHRQQRRDGFDSEFRRRSESRALR